MSRRGNPAVIGHRDKKPLIDEPRDSTALKLRERFIRRWRGAHERQRKTGERTRTIPQTCHASKVEYNRVTEWSRRENGCGELAGERPDARVARVQGDCVFKIRSEL